MVKGYWNNKGNCSTYRDKSCECIVIKIMTFLLLLRQISEGLKTLKTSISATGLALPYSYMHTKAKINSTTTQIYVHLI